MPHSSQEERESSTAERSTIFEATGGEQYAQHLLFLARGYQTAKSLKRYPLRVFDAYPHLYDGRIKQIRYLGHQRLLDERQQSGQRIRPTSSNHFMTVNGLRLSQIGGVLHHIAALRRIYFHSVSTRDEMRCTNSIAQGVDQMTQTATCRKHFLRCPSVSFCFRRFGFGNGSTNKTTVFLF